MTIGAAVFCARKNHYEKAGKPEPELTLKQSLMLAGASVAGVGAALAVARVPSAAAQCMRSAASAVKQLPKPPAP